MARTHCALFLALVPTLAQGQALSPQDFINDALGVTASEIQPVLWHQQGDVLYGRIQLLGAEEVLRLSPHSVRADDFRVLVDDGSGVLSEVAPEPVRTLRGGLSSEGDVLVAGSLLDDGVHARIHFADGADYWIQPVASVIPGFDPTLYAVYANDAVIADPRRQCEALPTGFAPVGDDGILAGTTLSIAELACDADFEYFQDYGSVAATQNRIESIINTVNVQYENQVAITHEITTIIVRTTSNDPYSSTNASTLLNQFRNHWNSSQGSIQRDVAHLFTGKNLNGGTIGIAWLSAICSSFAYGLAESNFVNNFACSTDLTAHELGHNWGANHCSCPSFTMNPSITCANTFNPSITQPAINSFKSSINCLETGGGGGPGTTVVYSVNFNGSVAGWNKSSGSTDLWRLVNDCVSNGSRSLGYSRPAPNCDYDVGTATGWARSPNISLSGASSATLSFRHFWQTESFNGAFDRMLIQASANGGSSWSTVKEINSSDPNSAGWVSEDLDVSGFISGSFRFRFLFDSEDNVSNDFLGWYIDDVVVTIN